MINWTQQGDELFGVYEGEINASFKIHRDGLFRFRDGNHFFHRRRYARRAEEMKKD